MYWFVVWSMTGPEKLWFTTSASNNAPVSLAVPQRQLWSFGSSIIRYPSIIVIMLIIWDKDILHEALHHKRHYSAVTWKRSRRYALWRCRETFSRRENECWQIPSFGDLTNGKFVVVGFYHIISHSLAGHCGVSRYLKLSQVARLGKVAFPLYK